MLKALTRRLALVENALGRNKDPSALERIDTFAKCVWLDVSDCHFLRLTRFLIDKVVAHDTALAGLEECFSKPRSRMSSPKLTSKRRASVYMIPAQSQTRANASWSSD
jgi:hypothetical protein